MSAFDPTAFLDAQVTEVNERRPPLPVENPASTDGLYTAVIGEPKTETGLMEKGDRAGQPWLSVVLPLVIDIPQQLQEGLKLQPTFTMVDRIFIDLTPQGSIDNAPGKNRRQRLYREALDMNKPGDVWSWRKAQGNVVKLKLTHEMYEGIPQERISSVLKS
jgi:hypothetical protein